MKQAVLIVDDNKANIKILVEYLNSNYEVSVALNGEDALKLVDKTQFDLILLDIIMPNLSGFEVCKKLYKKYDKFNTPIIFVTSSHSDLDIEIGFDLGAVDYITKPFKKSEIIARVRTHIQLQDYKNNLELRVEEEIEKNKLKEKIMFHQSKLISTGEMINSIAHQWRQPLNSINSAVIGIDTLLMREDISNNNINSKLEEIETQTHYMSKTIEDFSNYLNPNKERSDYFLREIVQDSISILHPKLSKNNIKVNIESLSSSAINCYRGEITQVIIVIINNAIDALKENEIKSPKITIKVEDNHICITDNAGGIKQKNIDDIFLPYFSTKKDTSGLGIGLYVAKMIIEDSNNGDLTAHNDEEGACFCIDLPRY